MRAITGFLVGIIAALVALSLGVIVIQNNVTTDVIFLGRLYQAPTGWLLLVFTGVGFVVAFLLLIPGRLGSAWRSWALSKQTQRLQDKLVDVQTQYALLEGEVRLLRTERQRRLSGGPVVDARTDMGDGPAPAPRPAASAASPYATAAPSHASVAVATAERPAPQPAQPSPAPRRANAGERLRLRFAMARGRLKARIQQLRKRFTRKLGDGSASKKPSAGTPVR
ncbi:MAG TPA: LapA family protein [Ktedonobacterales bacterium]|nr:LapA family protein [Ktedonobacterales bacterium]